MLFTAVKVKMMQYYRGYSNCGDGDEDRIIFVQMGMRMNL